MRLELDPTSDTRRLDERPLPSSTFIVVGVVRDVGGFPLSGYAEAGVYLPIGSGAPNVDLVVRVRGDADAARRSLLERLIGIDPNMGWILTFRTLAKIQTYPLQVAFWLAVVLGALALVLTLSGIFSVLSYLVEQRTKELGVRMALGATTGAVAGLVLRQSLRLVGVGLLVGGGLALGVATLLMATPAAAFIRRVVDVFDPVAYGTSLLVIVAACTIAAAVPALRAVRVDPITALRQD